MILDGYVRVSVVGGRGGEAFQSPTAQRDAIEGYAKYKGIELGQVYEDLDISGRTTLNRPGLQAILARIESGETEGIIVARIDRFSRSVADGLATIERIEKLGGSVVSTSENIDTLSANGKLQLGILLVVSQWYREAADEALATAQARAIDRGALPGRMPYGVRRLDNGTVETDSEQAAIVARMVTERSQGRGWKSIATSLTKEGISSPTGGMWSAATVQDLVHSEAALGVFIGPRGVRIEDAWTPMVMRATWDSAQLVQGHRDDARGYQDRLLAGIARCAGCRRTMRRTTNQQGHVSYGCTNRECPARSSIGAKILDPFVERAIDLEFRDLRRR